MYRLINLLYILFSAAVVVVATVLKHIFILLSPNITKQLNKMLVVAKKHFIMGGGVRAQHSLTVFLKIKKLE